MYFDLEVDRGVFPSESGQTCLDGYWKGRSHVDVFFVSMGIFVITNCCVDGGRGEPISAKMGWSDAQLTVSRVSGRYDINISPPALNHRDAVRSSLRAQRIRACFAGSDSDTLSVRS